MGKVAAGLTHEPDGRGVHRLEPACLEKPIRHLGNHRAGEGQEVFEIHRLEADRGAERPQLVLDGVRQK